MIAHIEHGRITAEPPAIAHWLDCIGRLCLADFASQEPLPVNEYHRRLRQLRETVDIIAKHGLAVIRVFDNEGSATWTYTVGLTSIGHPEIVLSNVGFGEQRNRKLI